MSERTVADCLAFLSETQQAFYDGCASKADLQWALDDLQAARRRELAPLPHNPPVKLR